MGVCIYASINDMGGNGTKLVTLLKERRIPEAMALWEESPELIDTFKPNVPIGWKYRETPMHLVARAGAKKLLAYLLEKGGNPFVTNSNDDTPIHIACTSVTNDSEAEMERRELLELLLGAVRAGAGPEREADSYHIIPDKGEPHSSQEQFQSHTEDRWNLGVVNKVQGLKSRLS